MSGKKKEQEKRGTLERAEGEAAMYHSRGRVHCREVERIDENFHSIRGKTEEPPGYLGKI